MYNNIQQRPKRLNIMQTQDALYYRRADYAESLLTSLNGITHAFTLFAPRRMGKTQFLLKDIAPTAERMGFNVFYFSFMDDTGANVAADFQTALYHFAQSIRTGSGIKSFLGSLNKIDIMGIGIGRENKAETLPKISDIITSIAHDNAPTLLLLDEVQELARIKDTSGLIRSLRTGLDINQNRVKTIFTGSSTNGLKAMFNNSKAPFFHFAHALDFPLLGKEFTDFLADVYQKRTDKQADKAAFYTMFKRLNHTPMYMRAVVQDMIITPELSLEEAASSRLQQLNEQHAEKGIWAELKPIEQAILADIARNPNTSPYSQESRQRYAAALGIANVSNSNVQAAINRMERQDWISRDASRTLQINNPLLQTWILENTP